MKQNTIKRMKLNKWNKKKMLEKLNKIKLQKWN